jgi:iron-sulfur cluster assembly accessory protein
MSTCGSVRWLLVGCVVGLGFGCNDQSNPGSSGLHSDKPPLITVTPRAAGVLAKDIEGVRKDSSTGQVYLRVRILPGGCTGFQHKLDLDPEVIAQTDFLCESEGIKVVVWKSQIEMLRGAKVDHGEKEGRTGYLVENPNLDGDAAKKWLPKLEESIPASEKPKQIPVADRIALFWKIATDNPENELAHYRLGQVLMEDGQYDKAVKSFERTLELAPEFSTCYQLLGKCLIKMDRKDRAIEVLTRGWTIADKQDDDTTREAIAQLLTDLGAEVPKK